MNQLSFYYCEEHLFYNIVVDSVNRDARIWIAFKKSGYCA